MKTEPKTAEELMSCKRLDMFSYDEILCDTLELCNEWGVELGHTIHVPRVEAAEVTPISEDSLYMVTDEKGRTWRPVLSKGEWYRQEVTL